MNEFDIVMEHFGFKDHETIKAFRQHLELRHYKKGDIVFDVGDVVPYIYIMVNGIARGYTLTKDGERITNCFGYKLCDTNVGQPFDFVSPTYAGFEYLTAGKAFILSKQGYEYIVGNFPEVAAMITKLLTNAFDEHYLHKIVIQTYDAEQRYIWFLKHYRGLIDKVPHRYIASYLGMTTVTLSRVRSSLIGKVDEYGEPVEKN